jgi:hypothetical protein
MEFMPNKSTPDYLFEKADQCFRRSRTASNARVELETLGGRPSPKQAARPTPLARPLGAPTIRSPSSAATSSCPVCAENFVRIDLVSESLNVGRDGRAGMFHFEAVGFAVQVE